MAGFVNRARSTGWTAQPVRKPTWLSVAPTLRTVIMEKSNVAQARRGADRLALDLGFDSVQRGRIALAVTEAATNQLRHAGGGEILVSAVESGPRRYLEILCLDRGPGIKNLSQALAGRKACKGSLQQGLGAIRRLADDFDIETSSGGTALLARVWAGEPLEERPAHGSVCRAKPGERACGDAWAIHHEGGRRLALLADGLGHGPAAEEASAQAVRVLAAAPPSVSPGELVERAHQALTSTRGVAVAVACADSGRGRLTFAGIGNVQATMTRNGDRKGLISLSGTVGIGTLEVREFEEEWPADSLLIMHTDGLAAAWDLGRYPGLAYRDPSLIAGVLYRDQSVERDDAAVVVLRRQAPAEQLPDQPGTSPQTSPGDGDGGEA